MICLLALYGLSTQTDEISSISFPVALVGLFPLLSLSGLADPWSNIGGDVYTSPLSTALVMLVWHTC